MFIRNGLFIPPEKAVLPISHIEFSYGFGVYESIRVRRKKPFFAMDHAERLLQSAQIIGLDHSFSAKQILDWIQLLVQKEPQDSFNIKMVLVGAVTPEKSELFLFSLNPLFPKPKEYRKGVPVMAIPSERFLPKAKTLNMLESYLAFKKAKSQNCFDALFVHADGFVCEGSRSNLFGLKNKTLFSAPKHKILDGVTRKYLLQVAEKNGFSLIEKDFSIKELLEMDSAFLTNTSVKILPIASIDGKAFSSPVSLALKELLKAFDDFLADYAL